MAQVGPSAQVGQTPSRKRQRRQGCTPKSQPPDGDSSASWPGWAPRSPFPATWPVPAKEFRLLPTGTHRPVASSSPRKPSRPARSPAPASASPSWASGPRSRCSRSQPRAPSRWRRCSTPSSSRGAGWWTPRPAPRRSTASSARFLPDPGSRTVSSSPRRSTPRARRPASPQMRQSQRFFGRPTLDLLQVESLRDPRCPLAQRARLERTAARRRYIGVTVSAYRNFEPLESFMRSESFDFVHVNYSVMEPLAEERILPLAQDLGMAVLTNRPFMNGGYFGRVAPHTLPEWGVGIRLRELGPVLPQVRAIASGRNLRAHRDFEPRAPRGEHALGAGALPGRGDQAPHAGAGEYVLTR